ncbi:hypothetical protein PENSPDRAFT_646702 [Peniophora sp. CONT]|nr:hypothetical protein PENSPDRAFT_646702 [Peniophora sp. CONT]
MNLENKTSSLRDSRHFDEFTPAVADALEPQNAHWKLLIVVYGTLYWLLVIRCLL